MGSFRRWLIFLPVAILALISAVRAEASAEPGLNAVGYSINNIPPTRSDSVYPECGQELENNINRNFEGEPFTGCGYDWFMVHYTGFISIPDNTSIEFMVAADDGGTVNIAGYQMGTWNLKGCSWSAVINPPLSGGVYPLDGWFFEAGGGTCYMLAWRIDDGYWEIVPEWAFTTTSTATTTTTTSTVPSTTVPATTTTSTTVPETTTSVETPTSVLPSTTQAPSTTVEATTTTLEATTTTVLVETYVPPPVIYTMPPTTLAMPEEEVPPSSVATEPEVIEPEESLEEELPLPVEEPEVVDTTSPVTVHVQESEDNPEEELVVEPQDEEELVVEPQDVVLDDPESMLEALDVDEEPSPAVAASLATNPEVLAVASAEQATQIFEALEVSDLSDSQVAALVAAVQDAPQEVREAFEETINIFGEGLDNYVPLGSSIPVGARRTLIAVTAGMALAAAATSIKKK